MPGSEAVEAFICWRISPSVNGIWCPGSSEEQSGKGTGCVLQGKDERWSFQSTART